MISSVEFHNFRVLRNTTLPLAPCTIIVGPNGSGKSTALMALDHETQKGISYHRVVSAGVGSSDAVKITINWDDGPPIVPTEFLWDSSPPKPKRAVQLNEDVAAQAHRHAVALQSLRIFELSPPAIAAPVEIRPALELGRDGANLAGVLDQISGRDPERFQALLEEFRRWLPEYDQVLLPTSDRGKKAIRVTKKVGGYAIEARDLSHGTLFALTLLTIAYLPEPPQIICLEDIDHGLHPRLMRHVRDAMYRLAYPETTGEKRAAVQVIATTHSPHLLDFFKDHPEEVVIAEKRESDAVFRRHRTTNRQGSTHERVSSAGRAYPIVLPLSALHLRMH